ncbi:hypothetical protein GGS20DRAFT_543960 [Poronia punctata]|nr:hypothetical protein GGS20DRAFT_543960 [Poronia punctata]
MTRLPGAAHKCTSMYLRTQDICLHSKAGSYRRTYSGVACLQAPSRAGRGQDAAESVRALTTTMPALHANEAVLEDRLRGLILTNAEPGAVSDQAPPTSPPEEGYNGQAKPGTSNKTTSKVAKKRPNQAQRRQMNAEMSISIDPRQVHPIPTNNARRPYQNSPDDVHRGGRQSQYPPTYQKPYQDGHAHGQSRRGHGQPFVNPPTGQQSHDGRPARPEPYGRSGVSSGMFGGPSANYEPYQARSTLHGPGGHRQGGFRPDQLANMSDFLDAFCYDILVGAEIEPGEIAEKENFRQCVEAICRDVVSRYEYEVNGAHNFHPMTVELKCFGSLASGFATKAADMDLGLLSPMSQLSPGSPQSPIPRLIEGALLSAGFGARLLTQTRIPIIKLCEKPDAMLRQSLLESRRKWESGLDRDEYNEDEDAHNDPDGFDEVESPAKTGAKVSVGADKARPAAGHDSSQPAASVETTKSPEDELPWSLRQTPNQTLDNYYAKAKRLLHRLGGRDVTHSNCHDLSEADFILLDKVARTYILGLCDTVIKNRIMAYPSFHIGEEAGWVNHRSLSGVNTMVEGERLILCWEQKALPCDDAQMEQGYERLIQQWKQLLYTKNFGSNPIWLNKAMQQALGQLSQIPFIQVVQLEQDQYEPPAQYYARTVAIATALSKSTPPHKIHAYVMQHYIDGIRGETIKTRVRDFAASTGVQTLETLSKMHKALHLAESYERAIEQGHYSPEHVPALQSYISILRRDPLSQNAGYSVPIMRDELGLLEMTRILPDPGTFGANKPKDKYSDSLEFPKRGVGVQCDINFSAYLALQNTMLLRCYSYTDPRVRPLVLFVKHWAKVRDINTPYRGTLSSYGYVLMVLHYLVNVVEPFVCPNLQQLAPPDPPNVGPEALEGIATYQGHNIRFWRDEGAIQALAQQKQLNQNHDSPGALLRGFFEYYAHPNAMSTTQKRGFDWGREVISLRTHGGLLTKAEKGWTGAKTVKQSQTESGALVPAELDMTTSESPSLLQGQQGQQQQHPSSTTQSLPTDQAAKGKDKDKEVKEVRHRFLFAIEDPFEIDHNVARTVTHHGIVSIRDEFRRAWRIIKAAGNKNGPVEDLLEDVKLQKEHRDRAQFLALLDEIHGTG